MEDDAAPAENGGQRLSRFASAVFSVLSGVAQWPQWWTIC